ncbi:MAG: InlB B-repeat-containing protein [Bacteroidales bacterium]|nr:InlB B-repeat-containing protein [Bacteroidales bacterium]
MKQLKHLKTLMMVIILSLLTTVAISCAEEKEGSKDSGPVTCRVSVSSGEGGTAETTETEVMQGWEVTLTAKPEETYRFVNWTVNNKEVSRENPYIAIVNTSTQFKANFEKDNYALKVTAGEGGSVKSTSEGELLKGTKVTLTATPNEGYSFVNWTLNGEVVSTKNIYTITITSDVEYIANFISYNVTVESGEGGTAKTDKMQVATNGKVTLTAISQEGYVFESWTVNEKVVSTANPYMATITADTKFKANFVTLHNVTITASEGGTAKSNKTQVGHNGQVTLTATPNEGCRFVNWTVEGKEVSTQNPYTTTITEDIEIKANFKDKYNGHGYVDLGLSVKWATCNVGAESPEDYGDYYAWGETTTKSSYTSSNYTYSSNPTSLPLSADAARVNWGGSWRMPTIYEQEELINTNNCTWTWTTQNGVNGYKVTSKKNGNSIFLPAAGYLSGSNLSSAGSYGAYRSSSLFTYNGGACYLSFNSSSVSWNIYNRSYGRSVRAVCP